MEEIDFSALSKKERKRLKKELKREQQEQSKKKGTIGKWITLGLLTLMVGFGIAALAKEFSKPLPGQRVEDLGREHVSSQQWEKYHYNSNPPTSGPHDATWTKAGIYDSPQGDGYLIHSLEHGYVIISYNCDNNSQECQELKSKLADLAQKNKLWKLIVVPRSHLDAKIALTAWGRLDKMDVLDKDRINRFIDAFRNKGPEKTME